MACCTWGRVNFSNRMFTLTTPARRNRGVPVLLHGAPGTRSELLGALLVPQGVHSSISRLLTRTRPREKVRRVSAQTARAHRQRRAGHRDLRGARRTPDGIGLRSGIEYNASPAIPALVPHHPNILVSDAQTLTGSPPATFRDSFWDMTVVFDTGSEVYSSV